MHPAPCLAMGLVVLGVVLVVVLSVYQWRAKGDVPARPGWVREYDYVHVILMWLSPHPLLLDPALLVTPCQRRRSTGGVS